eukprot:6207236-Amphidinium_carterae.2
MAGLEGRGYLWAGEYMDFHARASLYYKELRPGLGMLRHPAEFEKLRANTRCGVSEVRQSA